MGEAETVASLKAALKAKEAWYAAAMTKTLQQKEGPYGRPNPRPPQGFRITPTHMT